MSVSLIQAQLGGGTALTTQLNDLIVIFVYNTSGTASACGDSQTNSYTSLTSISNPNTTLLSKICYALAGTAGSDTINGVTNFDNFMVLQYRGLATSSVLDVHNETAATSTTNTVSVPSITTNVTDLLVSCIVDTNGSGTIVAGTNYVVQVTDTGEYAATQDRQGASGAGVAAGTYTPGGATLTASDNHWNSHMAAFKLPASAFVFEDDSFRIPPPSPPDPIVSVWG